MTISLNKQNQTPSLVKSFNSLTNSVSSFGLATIAIALLSVFSGNQLLDKAVTIFLVGSMVQTNVESKKRHEKAQTGLMIMDSQQVRLQRNVEDLEANLTVNNQRVSSAFSQLSLVTDSQKQLFAQLDSISHSVEAQLQLVVSKINELEAESNNSLPSGMLAALRDKVSRMNHQLLTAKLLTPDTVTKLEKLYQQVDSLNYAVETLRKEKAVEAVRIPTTENCVVLPPTQPERPEGDRVGVFVDGANVSISAKKIWGYYPDWAKLLVLLRGKSTVYDARYYDALSKNKYGLFHSLKKMGYEVISKPLIQRGDGSAKGNLDTELSNDMLVCADLYDTFVLVSCDGDFIDTVKKLRAVGKRVEVVSFQERTNKDLIKSADSYTDLTPLKDQFDC
jgi:uncharacterized LabA/DUF88 family protein